MTSKRKPIINMIPSVTTTRVAAPSLGSVQPVNYAPVYQPMQGLGQSRAAASTACTNPIWPLIGGAVIWAFFGTPILKFLGLGGAAATKGIESLRQRIG